MQSKDLGICVVHEFHKVFDCAIGNTDDPAVPDFIDQVSLGALSSYHVAAAELGERLKQYAASAKDRGDEAGALLLIRLQLIQEELAELSEAMLGRDIVGCFDALVDISYVTDGTYITLGLHERKEAGLIEVHSSNMSKLDENGQPIFSEAGRVVKGPNYRPPNLAPIVNSTKD
jgi:predicted HAD superfamily Cof-like phosphohydrolase